MAFILLTKLRCDYFCNKHIIILKNIVARYIVTVVSPDVAPDARHSPRVGAK